MVETVEVTQADRDAAKRATNGLSMEFLIDPKARDGAQNLLTYALARHRLAALDDFAVRIGEYYRGLDPAKDRLKPGLSRAITLTGERQ